MTGVLDRSQRGTADTRTARVKRFVGSHRATAAVILVGLVVRAVLLPITHGQDFTVWDLASRATLHGTNVYAHHPHYVAGPYAYFPLFLYLELPFQWLAIHTGIPFTVLGKLPIVASDVAVALLLARLLVRSGRRDVLVAFGVSLFFLNPLVLYNGAFYGRFDSFGCALLLAALMCMPDLRRPSWGASLLYGFAVAAKTFPVFVLPRLLAGGRHAAARILAGLALVLTLLSLPYLTAPRAYVKDIVVWDANKLPRQLSWQVAVAPSDHHAARLLSFALLGVFVVLACVLAGLEDAYAYTLVVLLAFLVLSKVVLEQYLIWPLPWLIWYALRPDRQGSRDASLAVLALLTAVGMLVNPYIHPFGTHPATLAGLLALAVTAYAAFVVRREWPRGAAGTGRKTLA